MLLQCELDLLEQALMTPCSEQRIRLSEQISGEYQKKYIKEIMEKLNNRPRKKNGFIKPRDMIKTKIV